jgi:ABC-type dipeptide/oligopeptide/nickel transport system permease subunit
VVQRFVAKPVGGVGGSILLVYVLFAVLAPAVAPHDPADQFSGSELAAPSARFFLGTDNLGRDVLSRLIYGSRVSLTVGVVAAILSAALGGGSGLIAGYTGGSLDAVVMRIWDAVFAVPAVLLGLLLAAAFRPSATGVAVTLGIATAPTFARLARATVLAEKRKEYIYAARALGATHTRVLRHHILPTLASPLLVQIGLTMAAAVLLEAGLSFLGLGVQAPQPSWGSMLAESREYFRMAPWFGLFPGLSVVLLVLALNAVSDALGDALDPRPSN